MKIAVVSAFLFDDSVGGAQNHIRFLCNELARRGHEIRLFKPVVSQRIPALSRVVDGLHISYVGKRERFDTRALAGDSTVGRAAALLRKLSFTLVAKQLCAAVDEFEPDVVWQHDFLSSWVACRQLAKRYPVVLTNHQGQYILLSRYGLGRVLVKRLLAHYAAVIGPSLQLTPEWRNNSRTIYNGVDTNIFRPLAAPARQRLRASLYDPPIDPGKTYILCPRRWAPTKGVSVFVGAVAELCRLDPEMRKQIVVLFAGNADDEYPRYSREVSVAVRNLECEYRLLGNLNVYAMVEHYQCADIVVIPSFLEAVSLAALEAMACECLVVASAVGGMPEVIRDGRNGLLFPPGDSKRLAETLRRAIVAPIDRLEIAAAGRRRVCSEFLWESVADETEEVLENSRTGEATPTPKFVGV